MLSPIKKFFGYSPFSRQQRQRTNYEVISVLGAWGFEVEAQAALADNGEWAEYPTQYGGGSGGAAATFRAARAVPGRAS